MKLFLKIISLILIFLSSCTVYASNNHLITDYHQVFFPCYDQQDSLRIAIRMYYRGATPYFLVVDPNNFTTYALPATDFKSRKTNTSGVPGYFTKAELLNTPYIKALTQYTAPPYKLENYGISQADHPVNGVFLTADMCPSVKPFEKDFFNALVSMSEKMGKPMPVALSISGLWIIGHPQEFNWLIQQLKQHKLNITWVNHSFSHVYYADLDLAKNFLLTPETNTTHEILDTEKLLLEHDQLPAVFFRFPGLISNEQFILKLRKYGLIPIGSNAWLAKDQPVTKGSFILVHGNSNEPEGIKKVMPLLQDSNYNWLPLSDAFKN